MDELIAGFLWFVVLGVGLIAVPVAYAGRHTNSLRFRLVVGVAIVYVVTQGWLLSYIFTTLRYINRDWLHALFLPIFIGLALPVVMGILWFFTRQRQKE